MGESVQEQCLIRGNPSNIPRAGGPILPQTKNVEQFEGDHQGPPPSSTKFPLAPALARQQTAKMVAVITAKFPLAPALARQQSAEMVAVITTKSPLVPALARQ